MSKPSISFFGRRASTNVKRQGMRPSGVFSLCLVLCCSAPARGEERAADALKFVAGAASAFGIHEAGHLTFDVIFRAEPRVRAVHYGPIPFFAISPKPSVSGRKLYTIAAAGFWTQMGSSELLLNDRDLRHAHAPFAKGMLAFDVLTSIGYAIVAFTGTGPAERDTRGMAEGGHLAEPIAGAIVLAPATFAAYRYFRPRSRWARWASRVAAAGSVAVVVRGQAPD
jgi:hypothetical protein